MSDAPASTPDDIDPETVPVNEIEDLPTPVDADAIKDQPDVAGEKDQTGGEAL